MDKQDIWARLAAVLPATDISWRQDGRPTQRDGKFFARFVAYVDANTVRERLDAVVPGEWDLTLELMPAVPTEDGEAGCSFKARLQILGVIREDVGTGRDYKSAATDAFKRAATRFGIAHELYGFEQNWVQVDSDSKFAKPVEDPAAAYARRYGRATGAAARPRAERDETVVLELPAVEGEQGPRPTNGHSHPQGSGDGAAGPLASDDPSCPKCGSRMWDNRASKRNPKAPDFKCRDRSCDGVIWPPKADREEKHSARDRNGVEPLVPEEEEDELPF